MCPTSACSEFWVDLSQAEEHDTPIPRLWRSIVPHDSADEEEDVDVVSEDKQKKIEDLKLIRDNLLAKRKTVKKAEKKSTKKRQKKKDKDSRY